MVVQPEYSNVNFRNGTVANVTNVAEAAVVFCSQSWYSRNGTFRFPAIPTNMQSDDLRWMTDSQEKLCWLYGLSSLVILVFFALLVFGGSLVRVTIGLFRGTYKVRLYKLV